MPESSLGSNSLLGLVETLTPFCVRGWAFRKANTQLAPELALWVDGEVVSWFRPQIGWPEMAKRLKIEPQQLGPVVFEHPLPIWVADGRAHKIEVRCAATGQVLQAKGAGEVCFVNPHVPLASVQRKDAHSASLLRRKDKPLVTVVVLNRNGSDVMAALLDSWHRISRTVAVEWIVIDHASTDDSLEMLAGWKSRMNLRIKALRANHSFSASCNRGAALAKAPNLLFLNNDIVWQHDVLQQMLATLEDPSVGAVGLKLIKWSGGNPAFSMPEVQHLGVRFTQQEAGYWPYEVSPHDDNLEAEFSSQTVPAVTGAVLLCRKADFEAVGGFDPAYFYGFEDVEFCLRLWHQRGLKSVCRNDLVALHRHGHTRLTGREMEVTDRLQHNASVLNAHLGLWAKVEWWRSLANGDRWLCAESLRVGWVMSDSLSMNGKGGSAEFRRVSKAANRVVARWPHAQVVLVHTGVNPMWARGLHVLVVSDPAHDIRLLEEPRPDLRLVAWVDEEPEAWAATPWWLEFDSYVASTDRLQRQLALRSAVKVYHGKTDPDVWGPRVLPTGKATTGWRVQIHFPGQQTANEGAGHCAVSEVAATRLQASFKQEGIACLLPSQSTWKLGPAARGDVKPASPKSAEVWVWIVSSPAEPIEWAMSAANINVIWWLGVAPQEWAKQTVIRPDWETQEAPEAAILQTVLERRLGRTFFAS